MEKPTKTASTKRKYKRRRVTEKSVRALQRQLERDIRHLEKNYLRTLRKRLSSR